MHDSNAFVDSFKYRPERYLRDGRLDSTVRDPAAAVFGFGRRRVVVVVSLVPEPHRLSLFLFFYYFFLGGTQSLSRETLR